MSAAVETFEISYLDPKGGRSLLKVQARSEHEARTLAGIPDNRILSVTTNKFAALMAKLTDNKPSMDVQANILNLFSVVIGSGAPVSRSFDKIVSGYEIFTSKMADVRASDVVSEKMAILGFDKQIILLAEIGEKTNTLDEVMAGAADDMIERKKVLGDIQKALIPSIVIVIFGILITIGLPLFVVEDVLDIMASPGIKFEANFATDAIILIGTKVPETWPFLLGGTIAVAVTYKLWWKYVRRFPVLSIIDDFFKQGAAYNFISSFLPLYKRGLPLAQSVEMVAKMMRGEAKQAFDSLMQHLSSGGAVSGGFTHPYWYPQLRQAMEGFDDIQDSGKAVLLSKMKPLLTSQIAKSGGKINAIFGGVGMTLALGVTFLIFMGMMWPMMTMGVQ